MVDGVAIVERVPSANFRPIIVPPKDNNNNNTGEVMLATGEEDEEKKRQRRKTSLEVIDLSGDSEGKDLPTSNEVIKLDEDIAIVKRVKVIDVE